MSSFDVFKKKFFSVVNKLESLKLKFFKRILGVHSKSTNLAVYGEIGRVPLIAQVSTLVAKYWVRIKTPDYHDTLVGKAANFSIQSNYQAVVFTNYVLKLCDLRSLDVISLPLKRLNSLGKYMKTKLFNYFSDYWKGQIQQSRTSGKLRTLSQVKNNFDFEKYLHEICNVKYRQAVTRVRVSAHRLPVESGRYNKIPYNERKCNLCHSPNGIGDEYHYLMSCTNEKFVELRYDFIHNI